MTTLNFFNILAIETSTEWCSIALTTPTACWFWNEFSPRAHAQRLLCQLDVMLKEAKFELECLDFLTFNSGPGRLTGLRIGCSIIQGLAVGLSKPIIPISNARVLAQKSFIRSVPYAVDLLALAALDYQQGLSIEAQDIQLDYGSSFLGNQKKL